jgi:hypothetical protein
VEHPPHGTIQALSAEQLVANYTLFPDRFLRDASGNLVAIDPAG